MSIKFFNNQADQDNTFWGVYNTPFCFLAGRGFDHEALIAVSDERLVERIGGPDAHYAPRPSKLQVTPSGDLRLVEDDDESNELIMLVTLNAGCGGMNFGVQGAEIVRQWGEWHHGQVHLAVRLLHPKGYLWVQTYEHNQNPPKPVKFFGWEESETGNQGYLEDDLSKAEEYNSEAQEIKVWKKASEDIYVDQKPYVTDSVVEWQELHRNVYLSEKHWMDINDENKKEMMARVENGDIFSKNWKLVKSLKPSKFYKGKKLISFVDNNTFEFLGASFGARRISVFDKNGVNWVQQRMTYL